jgi:hypothetical protein
MAVYDGIMKKKIAALREKQCREQSIARDGFEPSIYGL